MKNRKIIEIFVIIIGKKDKHEKKGHAMKKEMHRKHEKNAKHNKHAKNAKHHDKHHDMDHDYK